MTTACFEGKKYTTCKDLRKAVFEWCIEKDMVLPSGSSIVNLWKHWKFDTSLMTNFSTIQARCIVILISITEETCIMLEKRTLTCTCLTLDSAKVESSSEIKLK